MDINTLSARRSLVDHVVEQVRDNIESGIIKPSDRLPTEFELGARFGVSRTVIREATRRLQSLGLVEIRHRRGLFVGNQDSVRDLVRLTRSTLAVSMADLEKFNDFRAAIESHAARQAALKATASDIGKLQELCDQLVEEVAKAETSEAVQKADVAFHLHIAMIAGNDLIPQILQLVRDMIMKSMARTMQSHLLTADQSRHWHQAIVDAIRGRDAARAEQAMRDHMEAVQQRLRENAAIRNNPRAAKS